MEKLLYGRKKNEPDYMEQLLCTQPERFDQVKVLAKKDGFVTFRVSEFKLEKPDFTKALNFK